MPNHFLIIGAGFAGLTLAERLSSQLGGRCTIVEKRGHIGGNAQDEYDAAGVLVHKYGPHYFRTNAPRIVEIKHATGQETPSTTIVREYPDDYAPGEEAYYPIPTPETAALYRQYAEKGADLPNVSFVGRLATYRYYNMDQVVGMALAEFEKLKGKQ